MGVGFCSAYEIRTRVTRMKIWDTNPYMNAPYFKKEQPVFTTTQYFIQLIIVIIIMVFLL